MKSGIKQMRESCLSNANNNVAVANKMIAKLFKEGIKSKDIIPKDVSFKALFEGLVDTEDIDMNNAREVAEAISSSAFADVATIITSSLVIEPFELQSNEVMGLVTEGNAKFTYTETIKGMTSIGGVRRRLETDSYTETDFEDKTVSIDKSDFGRIVSLTMEDLFNDATGDIQAKANTIGEDGGQHMAQQIIETMEVLPRTALGEATSRAFVYKGTAYVQSDFYSADHSGIAGLDGQVNKNTATGGITEAGFTVAYNNFAALVDERGKRIVMTPTDVIVHSQYDLKLANLLASERSIASAALNDVNMFGPRGRVKLRPLATPWLATTTSLCYIGNFKRSLVWLWVQKPQTVTSGVDTLAFERQIVWRARFNYYGGCAHRDYRSITRITA
jgi:hypothetical protein